MCEWTEHVVLTASDIISFLVAVLVAKLCEATVQIVPRLNDIRSWLHLIPDMNHHNFLMDFVTMRVRWLTSTARNGR